MTIPEDILRELNGEWTDRLLVTATHTPKAILANALIALRLAPEWQGVLAYDELDLATFAMLPPPWLRGKNSWQPLRDGETARTRWRRSGSIIKKYAYQRARRRARSRPSPGMRRSIRSRTICAGCNGTAPSASVISRPHISALRRRPITPPWRNVSSSPPWRA